MPIHAKQAAATNNPDTLLRKDSTTNPSTQLNNYPPQTEHPDCAQRRTSVNNDDSRETSNESLLINSRAPSKPLSTQYEHTDCPKFGSYLNYQDHLSLVNLGKQKSPPEPEKERTDESKSPSSSHQLDR